MDVKWFRIRSWHILRTYTRVPGGVAALCGKRAITDDVRDDRPGSEKTCETCYRIGGPK